MPDAGVFVGRARDLEAVSRSVTAGHGVSVEGPAGIGKTRLIREAVALLEQDTRLHVARVPATSASQPIPLGALAVHLVDAPAGADDIARVQRVLVEHAAGAVLVIVADDAHLLDDYSAVAVHQLAVAGRALVLATLRSGEPVSSAVEALTGTGLSERLVLRPLDETAVTEMVSGYLGGPVDARLAHDAWVASRGNPMVVTLLVEAGLRSATVVKRHGLWTSTAGLITEPRLLVLISDQLDQLSSAERDAVELIALTEPLEAAVVERLIPRAVFETLGRRGLLVGADSPVGRQLRLVHPLFGEAARSAISGARRREAISALAAALDASDASEAETVLRVAVWGAAAECQLKPDLLLRAAAAARTRSLESAVHLLRAALAVGAPTQACLDLAQILTVAGRVDEAASVLSDFDRKGLTTSERVAACVTRAIGLVWTLQRPDAALAMIREQRSSCAGEPLPTALLDGVEAAAHLIKGEVALAEELASKSLVAPMLDEAMVVQSATVVSVAQAFRGRPESGGELALRWQHTGHRVRATAPQLAAGLVAARWSALELAGDIAALASESEARFKKAIEEGDDFLRSRAAQSLARVALLGARPRRAAAYVREVLVGLSGFDEMFTTWNLTLLAEALAVAGDAEEARTILTRCDGEEPIVGLFTCDRVRAEAAVLAAEGWVSRAGEIAALGARDAADRGMLALASRCWFDAARFGHSEAARELGRLSTVEGAFAPLWLRHAEALVRRHGQALDASAHAFAALGAHLWAAEAWVEAAQAHQRDGNLGKSALSVERARSLLDPADPIATPALRSVHKMATSLTIREREVVQLAARGLADRAIAGKLEVSVRTVETHLSRAYSKLGVQGRAELSSVLE